MVLLQRNQWRTSEVSSPKHQDPIPVIAAKNLPYVANANRLQTFNIYRPQNTSTTSLVGTPVTDFLHQYTETSPPRVYVHVHGGAWRDPHLSATSIEAAAAYAFSLPKPPIDAIISINYTLSPFPTHPTDPYDPAKHSNSDPAREAVHPAHIHDVLRCFQLLRHLGLRDGAYVLSAHSCGACLAFQAVLFSPEHWGISRVDESFRPPRPAALIGLNGLFDLPALVHDLGASHEHLSGVYDDLLSIAFGKDESWSWAKASPAQVDVNGLAARERKALAPSLVLVDQSDRDQLVPMNQMQRMKARLESVEGLRVVRGTRCVGVHAAPWEQGDIIWETVVDVLGLLGKEGSGI